MCLVAGKRLWVRAVAILLLLFAIAVVLPSTQSTKYGRAQVALTFQTMYLTQFGRDIETLLDRGEYATAKLRLAEFGRRFPEVAGKEEKLGEFFGELKAITNSVPLESPN